MHTRTGGGRREAGGRRGARSGAARRARSHRPAAGSPLRARRPVTLPCTCARLILPKRSRSASRCVILRAGALPLDGRRDGRADRHGSEERGRGQPRRRAGVSRGGGGAATAERPAAGPCGPRRARSGGAAAAPGAAAGQGGVLGARGSPLRGCCCAHSPRRRLPPGPGPRQPRRSLQHGGSRRLPRAVPCRAAPGRAGGAGRLPAPPHARLSRSPATAQTCRRAVPRRAGHGAPLRRAGPDTGSDTDTGTDAPPPAPLRQSRAAAAALGERPSPPRSPPGAPRGRGAGRRPLLRGDRRTAVVLRGALGL